MRLFTAGCQDGSVSETENKRNNKSLVIGLGQALFSSIALGAAVGLSLWSQCYPQSDMTKTWGGFLLLVIGLAGLASGFVALRKVSLKRRNLIGLLLVSVLLVIVGAGSASTVYGHQVQSTGASRCASYSAQAAESLSGPELLANQTSSVFGLR